ncbi:TonB-dependent receptor [Cellvibrio sp. NN19]|uniref:TonB-dependent receptor n=1 Tax=Cellvibrio chitinivorans TaxID=3102792 RepID=UPI002B404026|nr:TonB-dependent receptor [Cellvibrio sp. NN19]
MAIKIKNNLPLFIGKLLIVAGSYSGSINTYAQDKTSPELEEVLVTAQMRDENVQSVPLAIGAYDKEFVQKIGASSLTEMESAIPNINFGRGDRNTRGEIAIRGVGDYARNIGTNARVAVYIDGVLTGRSSSFDQSLLDVAHIEVLRGPQGTLAGTNALAGSINIVTQKPEEDFSAELRSDVGNFDLQSLTGKINLPLTTDLYASLLVSSTGQDGYIYNKTLERELQGVNRDVAKLKLRYLGVESLQLDIGFDYLKDDDQSTNAEALAGGALNGFALAPEPFVVAHNADEYEWRELKGATIEAVYETPEDFRWTSITGIRSNEFSELSEEDYSPLDVAFSIFDEKSDQISQEMRLASPQGGQVDYVVGLYFLDQDSSTQRSATTGPLFAPAPNSFLQTPATAGLQSQSLYLHGNYYFDSRWSVTAGVRYVHEVKNIDYSSNDNSGLFINVDHYIDEKTFNEWLPKAGINFQLNSDVLLYTSVARGYKSGGWNADFITTLEHFQFDPEYATNYEIGAKTQFLDKKLVLNLIGFVTKFDDFQVFQFVPTQSSGTVLSLTNAGKVTSQGIELDLTAHITDQLSLSVNTAYTQAKFDSFKNGGGSGIDYDDNYLPYAPEHTYFIGLDYRQPVFQQTEFYGHIDYGYTGDYFSNPNNTPDNSIPNYFAANARVGLNIGSTWDLSLWVKNLTDEANLRQRSVSFIGVPRGLYNPPRMYGASVNYSFD